MAKPKTEKALTLSVLKETLSTQLIHFYNKVVEPGVREIVSEENLKLRNELNDRFDFLFKQFEDLRQEYIVVVHQMKRYDKNSEKVESQVLELKTKVARLQLQVEELESRLPA